MAFFKKPDVGSWTENWPELGTGPVNYEDSIDPEQWKLEQQAIFRKTWLQMGRVELIPKKGRYITRELPSVGPGTSIIIVNDGEQIRAFYNLCRHRGNKLVWNDYPGEEVSGSCRQFVCKYHAWRYDLQGNLTFIQQEQEFFDVDKADYPLKPVRCEVWEGFIFVNFDDDAISLEEYLGEFGQGLKGYPFHEMTEHYSYRAEVKSNWKLFIDAFVEFYHAPILHMKQAEKAEAEKLAKFGFEALHYDIKGDHSMISSWGGMSPPKDLNMVKPIERILHSGLFGPWDRPAIKGILPDELPPAINPGRHKTWGQDSFEFFPNFTLLFWVPGWYLTYNYWPTGVDTHIFEANLYFVPPKNLRERLSQELAAVTFKEYAFQDANTLEATQTQIGTRAVLDFPLCDQEVLLRHLHHTAHKYVDRYKASLNGNGSSADHAAAGHEAPTKDEVNA
ncbi:aromatic ring-hydroxylating dioxygenase subunit alpha [Mycolicibacterium poriferae]|uniref:(2Fe-2S)-binding protein n=1 Tax=Mycolicibacterium poriferae TaxID=39694 RepID=A0A6N4VFA9_9MYCO|nr:MULTISPECIES: aromatic ring-hydroxylating dioxygenase subunit alpha [Mycolicibacterium]MCG7579239.1 aromatic ring-hydroxylating dioxygenase subunit alpha [Mycolicibacterium sp. OfavD-34-C]MCV7262795.1 aromatic ring-hydroxylating dioxygenase subunit alpha [Mycolicibacterium poriferae]QFS92842.1 Biphenyl dioxygenase subunit alpha [Mycobacterium sp. THAF192]BBX53291.1 (2Fe-2S)-binding protein [Mycolicibacterium poriferae]